MAMSDSDLALARQKLDDRGTTAVQSIQIENATGGTFTISFDGQTSAAIAYNAGGNVVQNALCALSNVGVGNLNAVENQGVPGSIFYVATFAGDLAHMALPMFTVNIASLTGAVPLAVVTQAQAGGVTALTDGELNANYALAGNNFFYGLYQDILDIQMSASKFDDYVAGQTQEKKSQIPANLAKMAAEYKGLAFSDQQVQIVRLVPVPPKPTAYPRVTGVPSTSLSIGPNGTYWRRNGWSRGNW